LVTVADPAFLSLANIANMLGQWAPAGIMAVAMTYVVIARGFDLSLASGFSLCAITAATIAAQGSGTPLAFVAALGVGIAIGCFNALLVCGLSINPFIATVGTGFILLGLDIITTPNTYITVEQAGFDRLGAATWHGMYYKGMLLIAFLIAGEFVLAKTRFGQYLYAIGGNREAARLADVPLESRECWAYVLCALLAAFSGMILASRLNTGSPIIGQDTPLQAIAAVVLGGTSLYGGRGGILSTVIGMAIIGVLSNGLNLLNVSPAYQWAIKGSVLILVAGLDSARRHSALPTAQTTQP